MAASSAKGLQMDKILSPPRDTLMMKNIPPPNCRRLQQLEQCCGRKRVRNKNKQYYYKILPKQAPANTWL